MKIISIINQKGGVGKTTTAMNLAAALGINEKKVLVLDLDSQANSTSGLGIEKEKIKHDLYDVLLSESNFENSVMKTTAKNVSIIPSTIKLAGLDIYFSNENKENNIFEKIVKDIQGKFDFVIIDCPPTLGLVNRHALSISDSILIPIQAEYFALEGLTFLLSTIALLKQTSNPKLKIEGILITMFDSRVNLSKETRDELLKFFKDKVYETLIPRNISLVEAASHGKSVFDFEPKSKGAEAYMDLAKEVLSDNE